MSDLEMLEQGPPEQQKGPWKGAGHWQLLLQLLAGLLHLTALPQPPLQLQSLPLPQGQT